jgi:hypothetical protein
MECTWLERGHAKTRKPPYILTTNSSAGSPSWTFSLMSLRPARLNSSFHARSELQEANSFSLSPRNQLGAQIYRVKLESWSSNTVFAFPSRSPQTFSFTTIRLIGLSFLREA